jgi:hypothetical protein
MLGMMKPMSSSKPKVVLVWVNNHRINTRGYGFRHIDVALIIEYL